MCTERPHVQGTQSSESIQDHGQQHKSEITYAKKGFKNLLQLILELEILIDLHTNVMTMANQL